MSTIKIRVLTASLFVAIMLIGMLAGAYTYVLLFAGINFLCLWEFYSLVLGRDIEKSRLRNTFAMTLGLAPFILTALVQLQWVSLSSDWIFKIILLYLVGFFITFVIELFKTSKNALQYLGFVVLGIVYIGAPFGILNTIAFSEGAYQMHIVLGTVLLIWTNDTAAYLIGSNYGKHHLFPRISPNKTWEGTIGAIITTLIIAFPVSLVFPQFSFGIWLVLALIISLAGGVGDLVESMIKRSLVIKDSSGLLPGHGGFLDRFDAFLFSVPFVAAFLIFAGLI
ncbi:MAG TPA: phosphatidate cytidylyltransferase [Saprospiraceae bacterium]|nr:phosphatidate cytidylyltransferase [Saprospiraceae bacterium]